MDARIKSKHDTTANWNNAIGFVPLQGEIIIYDDYKVVDGKNVPGIKIGSGNAYVQDLAFIDDELRDRIMGHINDEDIHVTLAEKGFWNNKVNIDDTYETVHEQLVGETLIFNRN